MPVEESGNMLIITAVIAAIEGNADYAKKHWETLTTWTNYLVEYGLDPETNFVLTTLPDTLPIMPIFLSRQFWVSHPTGIWLIN